MKRLFVVGLLAVMLLLAACAPQVSDEELKANVETLSDEDLDAVISESSQNKALAGQATAIEKYLTTIKGKVSNDHLLLIAQGEKIKRLEKKLSTTYTTKPGDYTTSEEKGIIGLNN